MKTAHANGKAATAPRWTAPDAKETISLQDPNLMAWGRMRITIIGKSPYLMTNGEQGAEDLEKHMTTEKKKIKTPKPPRDPQADFLKALVICKEEDGRPTTLKEARDGKYSFAVNAQAVLNMIVDTALAVGMKMAEVNRSIVVIPGDSGFIPFKSHSKPYIKRHRVMHGMRPDVAYRPCFDHWELEFDVEFNPFLISPPQIVSLIQNGGRINGMGAFGHRCRGTYGSFEVNSAVILDKGRVGDQKQ